MRKLITAVFIVVVVLAALFFVLPINRLAEQQIKQLLAEAGAPPVQFSVESASLSRIVFAGILHQGSKISAEKLAIDFTRTTQGFAGSWQLEGLMLPADFLGVPALKGKGSWRYEGGLLTLDGAVRSPDEHYRFDINLKDQQLAIRGVSLPWQGGHLSSNLMEFNLASQQPVSFVLHVDKVPLERLFEMLAPGKALATGVVSGSLPLTMDGTKITIASGQLKTLDKGVVHLSPEVIPATNEQMAMLRDVLSNFHYQEFSLALDSQKNDQLSIVLALRGRNPDLYDGREVKMNVNFSGDVLQLIQNSVLPSINPNQFLKQETP